MLFKDSQELLSSQLVRNVNNCLYYKCYVKKYNCVKKYYSQKKALVDLMNLWSFFLCNNILITWNVIKWRFTFLSALFFICHSMHSQLFLNKTFLKYLHSRVNSEHESNGTTNARNSSDGYIEDWRRLKLARPSRHERKSADSNCRVLQLQ